MLVHDLKPGDLIRATTHGCVFPADTILEVVENYDGHPIVEGQLYILVWCPRIGAHGRRSPWEGDAHISGYTKPDRTKALQHGQCWARIDHNAVLIPGRW